MIRNVCIRFVLSEQVYVVGEENVYKSIYQLCLSISHTILLWKVLLMNVKLFNIYQTIKFNELLNHRIFFRWVHIY